LQAAFRAATAPGIRSRERRVRQWVRSSGWLLQ
jgi:hypothetical protein